MSNLIFPNWFFRNQVQINRGSGRWFKTRYYNQYYFENIVVRKVWHNSLTCHYLLTNRWIKLWEIWGLSSLNTCCCFFSSLPKAEIFGRSRSFLLFRLWLQLPKFYSKYSAFSFVLKMGRYPFFSSLKADRVKGC